MKAGKTWCVAGLMTLAGFSSASCGKDEASGNNGGAGMIIDGGSSGSGGVGGGRSGSNSGGGLGRAGSLGTAGVAGDPNAGSSTKLGRGCIDDKDCDDTNAPGLTCVTATDTLLNNGAPPKGLCTAPCTLDNDTCTDYGASGLCYPFDPDPNSLDGYCVEGCTFGQPQLGEDQKCHRRGEFACNPALLGDTEDPCNTSDDCQAQEICLENDAGVATCRIVFPACLPNCRGDIDCEAGMYCDQSFLNGTCVTKKPTGKALGEPCTMPGVDDPDEPDECLGFCQANESGSTEGHCSATCGLGYDCAYNSASGVFDGACFYPSVLTSEDPAAGDFGFCTPACNCTAECNDPTVLSCLLIPQIPLDENYRGAGLCFSPDDTAEELDACGAGGNNGTAGTPGSDAGAGGGG